MVKPAGTTICLFFLWLLCITFPLFSDPIPDADEDLDDRLFFFEELFGFAEGFSFAIDEHLMDEDIIVEEPFFSEEGDDLIDYIDDIDRTDDIDAIDDIDYTDDIDDIDDIDYIDDIDDSFFFEAPPLILDVPTFEMRSFDALFPDFTEEQRTMAMSPEGLRHFFTQDESPVLFPHPDWGIDLHSSVMESIPTHLIEALVVVPYNDREFDLLDIYNTLGRIEKIQDQSVLLNGNDFYIFTESTRIENTRNRTAIPDPEPAVLLPFSETMYLRLREIHFGNLFLQGDISLSMHGITYSMTNFTDVRYFFIPLVRAGRFITILYLEPIEEGILIYNTTGFYLPGFIADRVNLTPNINRRIQIFINWITDGLRALENPETDQTSTQPTNVRVLGP